MKEVECSPVAGLFRQAGDEEMENILQNCATSLVPGKVTKSEARVSLNIVREYLNPCGSRVHVSCIWHPVLASVHSKAKRGWLIGARRMQKKASSKLRQVNQAGSGGIWLKRV